MSDVKTVKVDNWGSFFLQKLQNFFNKTDYCDLTLQFRDNSQLKVHRLVLSACTDYFNILETSIKCHDDVLHMPRELQADVVVPIVNFMYTGTLEFEVRMYERLLKTARDMKMSVLLKLLEAHKRTMPVKSEPIILNRSVTSRPAMRGGGYVSSRGRPAGRTFGNRFSSGYNNSATEEVDDGGGDFERLRRTGAENPTGKRPAVMLPALSPPPKKLNLQDVKEYTEAARLRKQLNEGGDEDLGGGDYEMDDHYSHSSGEETPRQSMSLLASNNKSTPQAASAAVKSELTTATVTLQELPGQKMDHAKIISEVMKKYPHLLKNNRNIKLKITQKTPGAQGTSFTVHAEAASPAAVQTPAVAAKPISSTTPLARALLASKQQQQEQQQQQVARRGRPSFQGRSLVAPKAAAAATAPAAEAAKTPPVRGNRIDSRTMHKLIAMGAENMEGPWLCLRCGVDGKPIGIPTYKAFRKHLINTHHEKIDARLCEHCGHRSQNRQDLYHHIQVKHQVMPPQGVVFPVCKTCKFVALDQSALDTHETEMGHGKAAASVSVTRTRAAVKKEEVEAEEDTEPPTDFSCDLCDKSFMTRKALSMHRVSKHRRQTRSKVKAAESDEEEEDTEASADEQEVDFDSALQDDVDYVPAGEKAGDSGKKVKVLSNVLAGKGKTRSSEADSLTTVATGIATSLRLGEDSAGDHSAEMEYQEEIVDEAQYIEEALASVHGETKTVEETKFIGEDGSEIQLTPEEKAELMSQLDTSSQEEEDEDGKGANDDAVVMMYEHGGEEVEEAIATTDAPAEVLKDGDDVLMVYGGPRTAVKAAEGEASGDGKTVVVEDEAVAAEDVLGDCVKEEQPSQTSIDEDETVENEKNKLIKELEGDWDDDADEKEDEAVAAATANKVPETSKSKESAAEAIKEELDSSANVSMVEGEEEDGEKVSKDSAVAEEAAPEKEAIKPAETSDKKAPEAALAEFMNDWEED